MLNTHQLADQILDIVNVWDSIQQNKSITVGLHVPYSTKIERKPNNFVRTTCTTNNYRMYVYQVNKEKTAFLRRGLLPHTGRREV